MSQILVTGGAGAVGSNLVRELLSLGHAVVVVDDLSSGHSRNVPDAATFVSGSITDPTVIEEAFEIVPEYVFHLAALFANQNSVEHPEQDLIVNGLGSLRVLEACNSRGVRKVIFNSSSCVYGNKEIMTEEDRNFDLDTPYAVTKLLGEHYCAYWARQHGLNTLSVRLFNSYGPGEFPGRYRNVIPNFIKLALDGKPLPITGSGEETRDFTYVGDIVRGLVLALDADTAPGDVINLGSGRQTRIIDVAEQINRLTGNTAGVQYLPRRSWDHVAHRVADIRKAAAILGYQPAVDLDEGLGIAVNWMSNMNA